MFFSWLIENKHFKKGSDIKGQITPLLIVIMVVLLILALVTINVGRIGLDKTYSSTAADAGALGAASIYAAAFNELTLDNQQYLWNTYVDNEATMTELLGPNAQEELEIALGLAVTGMAALYAGYYGLLDNPPTSCPESLYEYFLEWAEFLIAMGAFTEAAAQTNDFVVTASAMLSLVNSHHLNTEDAYCQFRTMMDDYNTSSNDAGYSYAFSNSGILNKLSITQQNAFSSWLSQSASYTSGTYSWQDQLALNQNQPSNHHVTVSVSVPTIDHYVLQHTNYGYAKEQSVLNEMITLGTDIADALSAQASVCGIAMTETLALTTNCILAYINYTVGTALVDACISGCCDDCYCCTCWCYIEGLEDLITAYSEAISAAGEYAALTGTVSAIVAVLTAVGGLGVIGGLTYLLVSDLPDALYGFEMDSTSNSSSCSDASDLLIVKISDVVLSNGNVWKVKCCETQTHPGTSQGLFTTAYPSVQSCAQASFDGGDVSDVSFTGTYDSYDSKITN